MSEHRKDFQEVAEASHAENNKRIAKNTLLMYVRMALLMCISLYTSRVILDVLGVEDYGIYNVVGGLVSMFAIINGSMTSATQRFLTFSLGKGDPTDTNKVFCVAFQTHVLVATFVVILVETVGIWFLNNKMQIAVERIDAAFYIVQFTAVSTFFNIISVPYISTIIAHERMSAFAFVSIAEATLKLFVVFLLMASHFDKLIVYGLLLAVVQIIIQATYIWYCRRLFEECSIRFVRDRKMFSEILSFAGYNLFGSFAGVSSNQALNMLLNMFFGPVVNAARGIAIQVMGAITQFITNFQIALNPQIVKSYAQGDFVQMHKLIYRGAKFSFFLMLLLSLPVLIETPYILGLWLKNVPEGTVTFLRITVCTMLIYTLAQPIMTANNATGKVKTYYIVCGSMLILILPISYAALRLGCPAYSVFIIHFIIECITQVLRLFMVRKKLQMPILTYCRSVYFPIACVTSVAIVLPLLAYCSLDYGFARLVVVTAVSVMSVTASSFLIGLDKHEREFCIEKAKIAIAKVMGK